MGEQVASEQESTFTLKDAQSHLIKTVIGSVVGMFIVAVTFYFKTTHDLTSLYTTSSENSKSIVEIKGAIAQINVDIQKSNTPMTVNQIQIENLQDQLHEVNENVQRLEDKVDKLLELQFGNSLK